MSVPYTSLVASTTKKFKKGFVDNIIKDNFLMAAMIHKDLAPSVFKREMREGESEFADGLSLESGGSKIFFPIMYATNNTVAGYSGYDLLDLTHSERFTAAEYDWASIAGSVNLDKETIDKNYGNDVKLFDYVEGQIKNLQASMQAFVNDSLIQAKSAGTKLPLGLLDIINDTAASDPSVGSVGGISVTGNAWWQNQVIDNGSVTPGTDGTGALQQNLRALSRAVQFGQAQLHAYLSGEVAYDALERSMVNQIRYVGKSEQKIASMGFESFQFKGKPVVLEKQVDPARALASLTGSAIYALNFDFLKIYAMKHRFFEFSDVKEPVNQDTMVQHNIVRMALCTNGRRYQGVLKAIVAP